MTAHALDSNGLAQCQTLLTESVRTIHDVVEQSNNAIAQIGDDFRVLVEQHQSVYADRQRLAIDIQELTRRVRAELNELIAHFYRIAQQGSVSSARVQHSMEPIAIQIEAALAQLESMAQTQPSCLTDVRHRVVRALQFNDLTAQALAEVADGALPTVAKLLNGPQGTSALNAQPSRSPGTEVTKTIERTQSGAVELF
jgi:hypothetical protein